MKRAIIKYTPIVCGSLKNIVIKNLPTIKKQLKPLIEEFVIEIVVVGGELILTATGKGVLYIIKKYQNKIGQVQVKANVNTKTIVINPIIDGQELFNLVKADEMLKEAYIEPTNFQEVTSLEEVTNFVNQTNKAFECEDEKKITRFRGKHLFLSSFYICPVEFRGLKYTTSEVAFQSMKFDEDLRSEISNLSAKAANELGKKYPLREDWHKVKEDIMYEVTLCKFKQNKKLAKLLIETGDKELIQENSWNDTEWGTVNGVGKNKLGKILMRVREEIK